MPHQKKNNSHDDVKHQVQIIAKMLVRFFALLRASDYGARHVGAAMERILILAAVRACEADGHACTTSQLAKMLKMPRSNVQVALTKLVAIHSVRRQDNHYVSVGEGPLVKRVHALREEVIRAGRQLEPL